MKPLSPLPCLLTLTALVVGCQSGPSTKDFDATAFATVTLLFES